MTFPKAVAPGEALLALIAGSDPAQAQARHAYWRAATGGQSCEDPALEVRLAADILACMGEQPPEALRAARAPMLARAASALRAGLAPAQDGVPDASALRLTAHEHPFRGFFGVERFQIDHPRFDGGTNRDVSREIFIACDAVTVLPYDPLRDRLLVIEQIRLGPLARGDARLWQMEAIAGRIDAGETPEAAARREALEEAGLRLDRLLPVAEYYPSPGAFSEYLYSYLALVDLPDGSGGTFGLAEEAEDIRASLMDFDSAMAALQAGQVMNGPLLLTLSWLARERDSLRRRAGA